MSEKLRLGRESAREVREEPVKSVDDQRILEEFLERRGASVDTGKFYYDMSNIPSGMTYEWKRFSCMGKEDRQYMLALQRPDGGGWKPVPADRHPECGFSGNDPIIIEGQMLMEAPSIIVNHIKQEALLRNAEAMNTQREKLEVSTNRDMPRVVQKWSRTTEPSTIPA